jgi:hypothetical protein
MADILSHSPRELALRLVATSTRLRQRAERLNRWAARLQEEANRLLDREPWPEQHLENAKKGRLEAA